MSSSAKLSVGDFFTTSGVSEVEMEILLDLDMMGDDGGDTGGEEHRFIYIQSENLNSSSFEFY